LSILIQIEDIFTLCAQCLHAGLSKFLVKKRGKEELT